MRRSAYRDLDRLVLLTPSADALGEIEGRLALERMALMASPIPERRPVDMLASNIPIAHEPIQNSDRLQKKENDKLVIIEAALGLVDDEPWSNGSEWVPEEEFAGS
ncbi:hypothetical protein ACYOEI_02220 [Singulisphaera rosea]